MSVEPLLALKPHWVSGRFSSAMVGTSQFSSFQTSTLPVMKSRVIPR